MEIFYPVQILANKITGNWLGLANESYLGSAVNFFIYDTIKIGALLVIINYLMAVIRYYFPTEKVRDILIKRRWFGLDYFLAASLGVITPFCSCSSIPLFIGFLGAGIPLGITFAFLIASPLVNESSLFLFPALFGLKTSVVYNLLGVFTAVVGGFVVGRLHLEKYVNAEFLKYKTKPVSEKRSQGVELKKLAVYWWKDGMEITKSVFPYVILGVAIGAVIHGFVPVFLVEKYIAVKTWWSVPVATLLGVPLYANSVSIIPIIEALIGKGVPLGNALAFMTATVTLSIPEALILKRVMKPPLLFAFFGITTVGIMLMGYFFNFLY